MPCSQGNELALVGQVLGSMGLHDARDRAFTRRHIAQMTVDGDKMLRAANCGEHVALEAMTKPPMKLVDRHNQLGREALGEGDDGHALADGADPVGIQATRDEKQPLLIGEHPPGFEPEASRSDVEQPDRSALAPAQGAARGLDPVDNPRHRRWWSGDLVHAVVFERSHLDPFGELRQRTRDSPHRAVERPEIVRGRYLGGEPSTQPIEQVVYVPVHLA